MKTRIIILLFLASNLLVTSCKKEVVGDPLIETVPIFRADGIIGGDSFSMIAGNDNFFMHTMSEKINGVDFFFGTLGNGVTELKMGIYDGKIDVTNGSFTQGIPEFATVAMNSYLPLVFLSKDLFPNKMLIDEIKWYVDGELKGINSIPMNDPGKFNVCAAVTFIDSSSETLCNEMIVGFSKNAIGQIRHLLTSNGHLQTWVEEGVVPLESVRWFIDGVLVSDAITLEQTITEESHLVTAEISFTNGVKRTKSIVVDGTNNGYFIDDFSFFENNSSSVNWDFNTTISLKINGKQYYSKTAPNESSTVHITDVAYFGKNSEGKTVFKISAVVSCSLKEEGTNNVLPFSCSTVFGVEID